MIASQISHSIETLLSVHIYRMRYTREKLKVVQKFLVGFVVIALNFQVIWLKNMIGHTVTSPVHTCMYRMRHPRKKLGVVQKFLVEFVCHTRPAKQCKNMIYNTTVINMDGTCSHGDFDLKFSHSWLDLFKRFNKCINHGIFLREESYKLYSS